VITRRALLAGLAGSAGLVGLGLLGGYLLRDGLRLGSPSHGGMMGGGMTNGGMMGSATSTDMSMYMKLFDRHTELRRTVDEIPGDVRTTTESDSPDLSALLQAHVSSMYGHVNQQAEVTCRATVCRHFSATPRDTGGSFP
jgi:hypothetical protein